METAKDIKKEFEAWMNDHEDQISEDIFEQAENPEDDDQKQAEEMGILLWDLQALAFSAGVIAEKKDQALLFSASKPRFTKSRKRKSDGVASAEHPDLKGGASK